MIEIPKSYTNEELLQNLDVLQEGHTVFVDGSHGNGHVNKKGFLINPMLTLEVASRLAEQYSSSEYDFIAGPVNFGAQLASLVAVNVLKPFTMIYIPYEDEKYNISKGRLHRDFNTKEMKRVLLVDDWLITGTTVLACRNFFVKNNLELVGVASVGAYSAATNFLHKQGVVTRSMYEIPFIKFDKRGCTLCKTNQKIIYENVRE